MIERAEGLIYLNDLHLTAKYSNVYHFPDDTNLLNFNNYVKFINKQVNHDLKNFVNWLQANKISLIKTELVLFISPKKQLYIDLKIKLNGKRLRKRFGKISRDL